MSMALAIPDKREAILALPNTTLYQLEVAGQLARDVLDERVRDWTEGGWTQQRIADELGCDQRTVGRRQARLGVDPADNRGRGSSFKAPRLKNGGKQEDYEEVTPDATLPSEDFLADALDRFTAAVYDLYSLLVVQQVEFDTAPILSIDEIEEVVALLKEAT